MKKKKIAEKILTVILMAAAFLLCMHLVEFLRTPSRVRELRREEIVQEESGFLEYYFQFLTDEEKRSYREILKGIRSREEKFYLTVSGDGEVDRVYHAVLKDHPEIFWVHNRKQVYKTVYANDEYCQFAPGYSYSEEETEEILASMEQAYQAVLSMITEDADDYDKLKTIYTYLIDNVEYKVSEDDQSIAGAFWKKEAVCAGYAGALQYLCQRFAVPCIYVEGSSKDSPEGHAWNIVQLDGMYYYVDATNGDQPEFLEGDAVQFAEHKTTIYDYLCPFPKEYELLYRASDEFPVPACTSTEKNFYVMNGACFDSYDWESVRALCRFRLDNGAAVVRFKFSSSETFREAYEDCIENQKIQEVAGYYMDIYGLEEISYHYGILENLNTMYFMF